MRRNLSPMISGRFIPILRLHSIRVGFPIDLGAVVLRRLGGFQVSPAGSGIRCDPRPGLHFCSDLRRQIFSVTS